MSMCDVTQTHLVYKDNTSVIVPLLSQAFFKVFCELGSIFFILDKKKNAC